MGAFNGLGQFIRSYLWVNDAANDINILAARMDTEDNGFAAGLSDCVTRDGQSPPTANLPMAGFKHTGLGTASSPGEALIFGQAPTLSDLSAGTGSALVGFLQAGTAAGVRTAQAKMRDTVNARDFGAIGDGTEHKLSSVYATLADAQVRYPFATSLNDTFDFCGIQAALNFVEPFAGCVSLEGRDDTVHLNSFYCNRALTLPNYVTLDGGSSWGATLDNQTYPLSDNAHFVNKDAATCNYITLRNLVVNGGDYGMKIGVTVSCEGWTLENVSFQLNAVNCVGVNKQLFTSTFIKCRFADAPIGFSVAAATTNAVSFYDCEWLSNAQSCIRLRGAEGVNIYGGRMEAGGGPAFGTIDLDDAGPVNFHGVYFENTSENILLETNSRDGVAFLQCHFSGWTPGGGGLTAYKVTSNGKVAFVGPHAPLGITGLAKGVLSGPGSKNVGTSSCALYEPGGRGVDCIISGEATLPNESGGVVTVPLFTFSRAGSSGATSNVQMVTGRLRVDVIGVASGGFDVAMFYDFPVLVYAVGIATIVTVVGTPSTAIAGSATLAVSAVPGATTNTLALKAVISGFTTSTALAKRIRFSFEGKDQSVNETDRFVVDLA